MLVTDSNGAELAADAAETSITPLVLVVEDDATSRKILKKYLERGGMDCHSVDSGQAAIEYLDRGRAPDLILSDISMPQMDGLEFCRRIRQCENLREVPLIFFTGASDAETLNAAFEVGASDYVRKPLRQDEVLNRSRRHIAEYRRKQQAKQRIQILDSQNRTKSKFLGVASHDLRNPLVSIRGISQFLQSERFGSLNEGQKEMIATIIDASESMLSLVEDLLDVSKMDSDQIEPKVETVSLHDVATHALKLHSGTAERKGISLELIATDKPAHANLDRKLFSRVLDNLVSNAIKFSIPGTRAYIVVDAFADKASVSVEDEGPGIPDDEFDKLFKEFSRTSNQPTGGESSSGIGLYMSKCIVTRLGGDIVAENRHAGGARFIVTFKRIQP